MKKRKVSRNRRIGKRAGYSPSKAGVKLTRDEKRIIEALKRAGNDGLSSRALFRESGVKSKNTFYSKLHALERAGEITVDSRHRVKYVEHKGVEATLVSLSPGFGFARPLDAGEDIFVHGSELKGAFVGDKLLLVDIKQEERGLRGRIKRVIEKSQEKLTGTVKQSGEGIVIVPDGAVRYNFRVRPADLGDAKVGDKVLIKPKSDSRGDWVYAKVISVFGNAESARVCADAIIESSGIPYSFEEKLLNEAKIISSAPITETDISCRLDLRKDTIFTIDGADAKDLDDAISVEKNAKGYKLGVHIADVSHYVKENTLTDKEAFERGTSVYFADRVIPMLPETLSNGVCSLNAGMDKLAFSALISFDKKGEMLSYDFKKSIINSKVRGVYSEINEIFEGFASKEIINKYKPVEKSLNAARELAEILKKRSHDRGEMELESGEIKFVLDENGVCVDLQARSTGEAEQLIEQMMISANIAASKFGQKHELPFVFRTHGKPQAERLSELCELLDRLDVPCKELKSGEPEAKDFAAVMDRVKGTTKESLVSQRILRTMEKAVYSSVETGHFGLSLRDYSHFTSPIRRYPDTTIHRIMSAFLSGMKHEEIIKRYGEFADKSAQNSSKTEIRAVMAERSAEDCYVAEYMKAHLGEHHTGIISGATPRGLFVRLKNGAEGFVSLSDFPDAEFIFDGIVSHKDMRSGKALTVGDELAIIVAASEVSTGRVDFVPEEANL